MLIGQIVFKLCGMIIQVLCARRHWWKTNLIQKGMNWFHLAWKLLLFENSNIRTQHEKGLIWICVKKKYKGHLEFKNFFSILYYIFHINKPSAIIDSLNIHLWFHVMINKLNQWKNELLQISKGKKRVKAYSLLIML